ncbi:MAG: ABC transporter ATP-binding protein, partial [Pseudomonadota bacterium]
FPHLSVLENIAFGLRNVDVASRRARAEAMLRLVGLEDFAERNPGALSGGQQQRVAVARALAPNPAAMLLDEPFANLDAGLRRQLRVQALGLLRSNGAPALFVTHDAEEAMLCADRIAVMRDGAVLQIGRPDEVYFQPNCAFVARFFGEMNRFVRTVRDGVVRTPLGEKAVDGFADGDEVEVLIRPEAIKLAGGEGAAPGAVSATRFAGETQLITVDIADADGHGDCCLECRVFGYEHLAQGDAVRVEVDRTRIFVFPLDRDGARIAA